MQLVVFGHTHMQYDRIVGRTRIVMVVRRRLVRGRFVLRTRAIVIVMLDEALRGMRMMPAATGRHESHGQERGDAECFSHGSLMPRARNAAVLAA